MIRALGAGQGVRGLKHRHDRPTLIPVDDLENQEECASAEQRHKLWDWFHNTLLKAGTGRTNVIVVGTIVHYDSLLAKLTAPTLERGKGVGWDRRLYRAVEEFAARSDLWDRWEAIRYGEEEHDDQTGPEASGAYFRANRQQMLRGTKVLWGERETYLELIQMRADEGRVSFQCEKQNEPVDPEECLFSQASLRYWDDDYPDVARLLRRLGPGVKFYGACDPSLGRSANRGDFTAIVTLAQSAETKTLYVIDADIARRTPDQTIARIVALSQAYKYRGFAFESNQFQEVLAEQLRKRAREAGVSLYPKSVTNTTHKQTRIESLEPLVVSGQLRFSRRHQLLLEQLRQFRLAAHDDGPDALEMAVEMARKHRVSGGQTRVL